ncbi:TetR/AcrR family transcriptional regulator [Nocardioides convexus]|uniref:TetR/AcrR family transcriptional regulator n=1 Tax=Nocardioides convexus TaxID=2712224 RepID=UPI002418B3D3|nr:TetR/AcrR family transcriptional regulator [Nocardioides convexus]
MAQRQRARPRQERAVQTRRRLLDTAVAILDRDGIDRLTTTAVIERAHVSSGTFYRYFNDRAESARRAARRGGAGDQRRPDGLGGRRPGAWTSTPRCAWSCAPWWTASSGTAASSSPWSASRRRATTPTCCPRSRPSLHHLATLLPRRHLPGLDPDRLEGVVFMLMGVLVSTCLRIALGRPDGVDREQADRPHRRHDRRRAGRLLTWPTSSEIADELLRPAPGGVHPCPRRARQGGSRAPASRPP